MKRAGPLALLAIVAGAACVPDAGRPDRTAEIYSRLLAAEDARPSGGGTLSTLLNAAELEDPFLRRTAVRALGRLESPELSSAIGRRLDDPDPGVRGAAAEALAQSVHRGDAGAVLGLLLERVERESDAVVRGTLARSLGRLRLDGADRRSTEHALVLLSGSGPDEPAQTVVGVALGFASLVRRLDGGGLGRPAADRLAALMSYGLGGNVGAPTTDGGRVRALAATALGQSRRLSLELIRLGLDDPDPEVRRSVVPYLGAVPPSTRDALVLAALADTSARVVTEALRYLGAAPRTATRCESLIAAAAPDVAPAIRISALEALARPCPTSGAQRRALLQAASELDQPGSPWQPAARALLSLSSMDRPSAADLQPRYATHASPFVRAYAARAAAALRDGDALRELAGDPSPNVRTEAVRGLFAIEGHGADDVLLGQLERDDPQLLLTVAGLLEGSPDGPRVASAVLAAFERISRDERETWRDARLALLGRLGELGDASLTERLTPFLRDYDALVASTVEVMMEAWTGREHTAESTPLPRAALPTLPELRTLAASTLTLHIRGGGALVIELHADQATTNVARVVRLARAGYYDGLTFHRWAPNFVIQGGSPGANEYQGDGPYTRDEVGGVPHWRGTVGISTRGRDTGDAQIFINLVDNPRLDHDYTVVGTLLEGYDILDVVLEGTVIERAEVALGR